MFPAEREVLKDLLINNDSGLIWCELIGRKAQPFKGKGTQKYEWILSKSIWKTAHFDAKCMKIGFLVFMILQFYVFQMATIGGRHFEMPLKLKIIKPNLFL